MKTSEQAFSAVTHGTRFNLKASSITSVQMQVLHSILHIQGLMSLKYILINSMVENLDLEPEVKHENVLWNATEVDKLIISVNQFCRPRNPFSQWHETDTFDDISEREDVKFIDTVEDETLQKKIAPFLSKVDFHNTNI
jgi:hypothetical protein